MTAAFIVTLEVEATTPTELEQDAMRIEEVLWDNYLPVVSVEPWSRQGAVPEPDFSNPTGLHAIASVLPVPVRPQNNQTPIQPIEPI